MQVGTMDIIVLLTMLINQNIVDNIDAISQFICLLLLVHTYMAVKHMIIPTKKKKTQYKI